MAEIAADGGAITVDPRDDHAIADAMRRLLIDDELLRELEKQARGRPTRTWDDYARETWSVLVGDEG
jgi:glycosyltransferase involved in cell wall biosynthesis